MLLPEELEKLNKDRMNCATNSDFMNTLFSIAEKYQIFTIADLELLTSSEGSHDAFSYSTKPILLDITGFNEDEIAKAIHDDYENGRSVTRYYRTPEYIFLGKKYVASNDMYGKYKNGEKRSSDNRTPLYYWVMKRFEKNTDSIWLPKTNEYHPGITKEQWISLLTNKKIFTEKNLLAMACIYDNGGEGSCIELAAKYNQGMVLWRTSCGVHLASRIAEETKCPLMRENGKTKYFVIPFLYRKTESDEDGSWIYKLRPELYDALTKFDILRYLPKEGGEPEVTISDKEALENVKKYIEAKGFSYPDGLIENFYLSLKSKPFVILAGTSGTGKTRLVRLFSEAIGATASNGRYKLVSVRPDWSDSSDLFGHVNLQGEFVPGAIIDFVYEACQHTDKPYFLCLDEMNLARVEYYLSDFLSVIETRHRTDKGIETDGILLPAAIPEKYQNLILPENLYVIGTVNMDETTFPFSKKVLDRANTIEFSYVDLEPDFSEFADAAEPLSLGNDFLKTQYLILKSDIPVEDRELAAEVSRELQKINEILLGANAHVGYRVRDEIVFYMVNNKKSDLLGYDNALDNEIMQKILPRIQGSSASVKAMLCELFKKCAGDYTGLSQASISEQMQAYVDTKECKYRKSAEKISYMMRRYEEDGFTSYWL